ncbi:MAG: OmpA family protein [Nitrosomonas sp.]|nr:OmpA family protein [Nitrosomonas sp.]
MLHRTGQGKINVDSRYAGPGMIKALLYNFDIDGDTVKPEHIAFLQSTVVPLLQGDRGHIWMQGSTSKSGSNQYNLELSKRRVNNIAAILRTQGIFNRQMQLDAIGEEQAQTHAMEEESDRAVALVVIPVAPDSPPPPKKIPPPPPVNSEFKIRMLAGLAGTAGPFQVENNFSNCRYQEQTHRLLHLYERRSWRRYHQRLNIVCDDERTVEQFPDYISYPSFTVRRLSPFHNGWSWSLDF